MLQVHRHLVDNSKRLHTFQECNPNLIEREPESRKNFYSLNIYQCVFVSKTLIYDNIITTSEALLYQINKNYWRFFYSHCIVDYYFAVAAVDASILVSGDNFVE